MAVTLEQIVETFTNAASDEQRAQELTALLSAPDVDLDAVADLLTQAAGELADVEPDDLTDAQLDVAEAVAAALTVVEEIRPEAAPENDEPADDEDADQTASAGDEQSRTERARAVAQSLRDRAAPPPAAEPAPAEPAPEAELVAASASAPARRRVEPTPIAKVVPAPAPAEAPQEHDPRQVRHSVIAAGDLPGYRAGQRLADTRQIAEAVHTGMTMVSRSRAPGASRQLLASIKRDAPDELTYNGEGDWGKVDAVCDQKSLPGQSLTAAGGWCAPSEVLYDTCPIVVSRDGMVDLPTITTSRGGVKFSGRPDFSALWSSSGLFFMSEVDAIAGVEKPCTDVPCPDDLLECRNDLAGICLRQPLLSERGWPEKIEEFMQYALLAHAHRINAERIRRMVAQTDWTLEIPAPGAPGDAPYEDCHGPGAAETVLSAVELQVEFLKYRWRLARGSVIEGIAPYWLRGILRADLSKKLGVGDRWSVTDAQLDAFLLSRGVRIQWVYDWQDALSEGDQSAFGGAPPMCWPETVDILLYEPGTYFGIQQDVITLEGVFDSVGLQQNVYTRLFTEEGFGVCKRCGQSLLLTIPLCPNGLSGSHQRVTCPAPVAA